MVNHCWWNSTDEGLNLLRGEVPLEEPATCWVRKSRLASRPSALREGVLDRLPSGVSKKSASEWRKTSAFRKFAGLF